MDRRQKDYVKKFAEEVFNYNSTVVNAFDDEDLRIIRRTFSFQLWYLKQTLSDLLGVVFKRFS